MTDARWAEVDDDFDSSQAGPSIEAARRLATSLKPCVAAFKAQVDPLAAPLSDA